MTLTSTHFEYISQLVYDQAAIVLDKGKEYLVDSRMRPLLRSQEFADIAELVENLSKPNSQKLRDLVIDAMTTNETSFFRDQHPFETLKSLVVPEIIKEKESTKELKIWCGASSSGQEPYTIAMVLKENFPELRNWKLQFLATDISIEMLQKARSGSFSELEVNRGLPAPLLVKYFSQSSGRWQISNSLRSMIRFEQLNLVKTWPALPRFDLIFLRNVLIYFDMETKKQILMNMGKQLAPNGFLYLGGTETLLNSETHFNIHRQGKTVLYRHIEKE